MIKPETAFRIYEIRAEKSEIKDIKAGIYRDTDQKTITCSSKSITSALNESYEDNTSKVIAIIAKKLWQMPMTRWKITAADAVLP